jgi:ferredoxin
MGKKPMSTYRIQVQGGPSFHCPDHRPILFAAREQGVTLPFGCRVGGCGQCVAQVMSGRVDRARMSIADPQSDQRDQGFPAQLCVAYPLSDCTIRVS